MSLKRLRWPPHLSQELQSCQAPHTQGFGGTALMLHGSKWHSSSSESAPTQALPPSFASVAMLRRRALWPLLQVTLHLLQSIQLPNLQSTCASSLKQPGVVATSLQGETSFVAPLQASPLPCPYVAILRERCLTPLQEHEQSPHSFHWLNKHATSPEQPMVLQGAICRLSPSAGVPQAVASVMTLRTRHLMPPPQVAEHSPHSSQSCHVPSMQSTSSHDCVLQGTISLLTCTGHNLPAPLGATLMCRSRVIWPPPQRHVHPLHSVQSAHSQSVPSGGGVVLQCAGHLLVSMRLTLQGFPHSLFGWKTPRSRMQSPVQSLSLQLLHSLTSQSTGVHVVQGLSLHSVYLTSFPSQAACVPTTHAAHRVTPSMESTIVRQSVRPKSLRDMGAWESRRCP
mmetsp:Transcript_138760/g.386961  ORF Transcript_138760/g.386961 Transcript_138760/m.386961 type:complete len:396 (+) Transcript_138760:768-1955(+)